MVAGGVILAGMNTLRGGRDDWPNMGGQEVG